MSRAEKRRIAKTLTPSHSRKAGRPSEDAVSVAASAPPEEDGARGRPKDNEAATTLMARARELLHCVEHDRCATELGRPGVLTIEPVQNGRTMVGSCPAVLCGI
jgi:hypothetical protein